MRLAKPTIALASLLLCPGASSPQGVISAPEGCAWLDANDPSPMRAIQSLFVAYVMKDPEAYGRLLTLDFSFGSAGSPEGPPTFLTRDGEIAHVKRTFEDVGRPSPGAEPAVREIEFKAGPFLTEYLVGGRRARVFAASVTLRFILDDGSVIRVAPAPHVFELVRGDAAVLPNQTRGDAGHWYISRWEEFTLPAVETPERVVPDPIPPTVLRLALAPLQNPARGTFKLRMTLPSNAPARIVVVDVMGRRMLSHDVERGTRQLVLDPGPSFPAGVYWLRLFQGRETVTAKIVLIR
jgi:hypothetical protein